VDEAAERKLVARAKDADWEAFDELMEAHQEVVYRLVFRLTGRHDEAEAVTQDAFVQAYLRVKQFAGRSRFVTWLSAIAIRRVRDSGRRARKSRTTISLTDCEMLSGDGRRPGPGDPSEALDRKELQALVTEALQQIPWEKRTALILVVQEGLSYRDASEVTGCSEGTVAWRVWDARRLLRDLLAGRVEFEGKDS